MAGHGIRDRFVLLDACATRLIDVPLAVLAVDAALLATGVGDDEPAGSSIAVAGYSVRPPAPVHLAATRHANGDILISWVIGEAPSGDLTGEAGKLPVWGEGGWRFLEVPEGAYIWLHNDHTHSRKTNSVWNDGEIVGDVLVLDGTPVVGS